MKDGDIREPITLVELYQSFCSRTYGVGGCTAALGVTGDQKCYNTMKTCQVPNVYDESELRITFSTALSSVMGSPILPGEYVIPTLVDVETAPTVLNPGAGGRRSGPLGQRAQVRITIQDAPGLDTMVDPYRSDRGYLPEFRGTWWTKWLARNPYYTNRRIVILEGYRGQTRAQMVSRTYLIDKIDGPDSKGRIVITAKDVLKLADDDKAQAPAPSLGMLVQDYAKGDSISTLRVTGAAPADYPAPGTVRINRELFTYSGVTVAGGNETHLTGVTRATDGTELKDHKAGDRVQLCLRYTLKRVDDLAYEWLTQYGNVPASYIDQQAWEDEADLWLGQYELSGLITEPTGITSLLGEISEQCLLYIWWDEREQKIRLEAVKPPIFTNVPVLTDDADLLEGSVKIQSMPDQRASQVWIFWSQRDPTEGLTREENYAALRVRADLDAELPEQYDEKKVRKIYSRWLTTEGQITYTAARLLDRYRDVPQRVTVTLDARRRDLWTGSVLDLMHHGFVDFHGLTQQTRWQVVSAREEQPGHTITLEMETFEFAIGARFGRWMADQAPEYSLASPTVRATGMWWSESDGTVDGDPGYQWI